MHFATLAIGMIDTPLHAHKGTIIQGEVAIIIQINGAIGFAFVGDTIQSDLV